MNIKIKVAIVTGIFLLIASLVRIYPSFNKEKIEIVSFELNENEVFKGDKVFAKWEVKDAETVHIEIDGKMEKVSNIGDFVFYPKENITIHLIAENGNSKDTATRNVLVKTKPSIATKKRDTSSSKEVARKEKSIVIENEEPSKFILAGRIKNQEGIGIQGVEINFKRKTVFSDNSGNFTIEADKNEEGRIVVGKEGYDSFEDYVLPPKENISITLKRKK